ncbi:M56 family metallopeptidase [Flavobacteriaceae bacterium LMO-SS05]
MLIYVLKSSACLAIFMIFYKLFMEKENMHQLKRYYLIVSLIFALCIPLITITYYIELPSDTVTLQHTENGIALNNLSNFSPIHWSLILWTLYGLGSLLFSLKFIRNLLSIVKTIKCNPKHKSNNFINVLLEQLKTPHTFFNYIFLNKHLYETQQIPKEVFVHEQAHAEQKHSLDILFIELIQIVFWYNPLIYLFKKDVKLNHEFLADQAVLKQGNNLSNYQQLLLAFSSNAKEPHLAHAINYSSIKKRFTVMKTHTSKQTIYLRSFLLLPLLVLTLYGFSDSKEIVKADTSKNLQSAGTNSETTAIEDFNVSEDIQDKKATPKEVTEYNKLAKRYNNMPKDRMQIMKKDIERLEYLYGIMTKEQKTNAEPYPSINIPPPPSAPKAPEPLKVVNGEKMPPPPPIPDHAAPAEKIKMQKAIDHYNNTVPPPPPPPAPKSPLEHIIEMAERGASFYYEGKPIASEEAIKLLKTNEHLNISTKDSNSKQAKVYITKDPIVIKD